MNNIYQTYLKIIGVVLSLYLFLVGINGLSTAIKNFGGEFANNLLLVNDNAFIALFVGILLQPYFRVHLLLPL